MVPDRAKEAPCCSRRLFDAPELGLRLLHAARGAYDLPIGRLVTTDLLEPGNYLNGGELVLTGLVWRRSSADSETFVASVAERGATTILAGKALLGTIPDDLLEACRRHQVTLVEVPTEVAFADVTEYVAAAGAADTGARLSASLVRQRQLLSAIASGRSLDEAHRPDLHRDRARLPGHHLDRAARRTGS